MAKSLLALRETTEEEIVSRIYLIRGQKVMLDKDLAEMYGVEVRALNQAVKRNLNRFSKDYMFQLTPAEMQNWKSQIVISNAIKMGLRKPPFAFTEHGVLVLAFVLRSDRAVQVSSQIIEVYIKMRQLLSENKELWQRIESIERRMDKKDEEVQAIFAAFKKFLIQEKKPANPSASSFPQKRKRNDRNNRY